MGDAFYTSRDGLFVASAHTRGPWSREHQHGGPVAALVARAVEREAGADVHVARLAIDFLRPLPIAALEVRAQRTRDGRLIKNVEVEVAVDGKAIARGRATTILRRDVPAAAEDAHALPAPDACPGFHLPFDLADVGYHTAMDVRLARGEPGKGHVTVWMRARLPLLDGEPLSPLARVMIAADSGNGVSARLDPARFTFLNADLSVCLHRYPDAEWVALDAQTSVGDGGVGLTTTRLYDARGPLGAATQPLVIANA